MLRHRLTHRIAIQEPIETRNTTTGEIVVSWQNVVYDSNTVLSSVPAEVLTGAGKELYADQVRQSMTSARITIRYLSGITTKMRVVWDGNVYDIAAIETDRTARRELRLRCETGLSEG